MTRSWAGPGRLCRPGPARPRRVTAPRWHRDRRARRLRQARRPADRLQRTVCIAAGLGRRASGGRPNACSAESIGRPDARPMVACRPRRVPPSPPGIRWRSALLRRLSGVAYCVMSRARRLALLHARSRSMIAGASASRKNAKCVGVRPRTPLLLATFSPTGGSEGGHFHARIARAGAVTSRYRPPRGCRCRPYSEMLRWPTRRPIAAQESPCLWSRLMRRWRGGACALTRLAAALTELARRNA